MYRSDPIRLRKFMQVSTCNSCPRTRCKQYDHALTMFHRRRVLVSEFQIRRSHAQCIVAMLEMRACNKLVHACTHRCSATHADCIVVCQVVESSTSAFRAMTLSTESTSEHKAAATASVWSLRSSRRPPPASRVLRRRGSVRLYRYCSRGRLLAS